MTVTDCDDCAPAPSEQVAVTVYTRPFPAGVRSARSRTECASTTCQSAWARRPSRALFRSLLVTDSEHVGTAVQLSADV